MDFDWTNAFNAAEQAAAKSYRLANNHGLACSIAEGVLNSAAIQNGFVWHPAFLLRMVETIAVQLRTMEG